MSLGPEDGLCQAVFISDLYFSLEGLGYFFFLSIRFWNFIMMQLRIGYFIPLYQNMMGGGRFCPRNSCHLVLKMFSVISSTIFSLCFSLFSFYGIFIISCISSDFFPFLSYFPFYWVFWLLFFFCSSNFWATFSIYSPHCLRNFSFCFLSFNFQELFLVLGMLCF